MGHPPKGIRFALLDVVIVPFALAWTGVGVSLLLQVVKANGPWIVLLVGLPFLVIGLYLAAGRFLSDAFRRSRTAYCVTDRRALIVSWFLTEQVRSIPLGALSEVRLIRHKNKEGTIVFGPRMHATRGEPQSPRFEWLEDFEPVFRIIATVQDGPTEAA